VDKGLDDRLVGSPEYEGSAVRRVAEGSGEDYFAARVSFAGESKMLIAEGSTASDVVIDEVVGEKIVVQAASLAWGEMTRLRPLGA